MYSHFKGESVFRLLLFSLLSLMDLANYNPTLCFWIVVLRFVDYIFEAVGPIPNSAPDNGMG
jgi:hypothetical protein